ncbi:two-component system nitrogen regulation sensor histidine kinase NtrY [Aliiruegeria haliotis]|uniref:histidine kinase n=1 Tax=Aliiruegeria haliotis TaxID=1280846 RepID=A0A2T0RZX3_9RHOB|nr:PAS domain-containing sensor histidine kinase [Aliiruegeria haliotis]PRY26724.1 two-component system nitrogen regulation sensor histidine kinase NtrY [Aliiruegeria haliotis]
MAGALRRLNWEGVARLRRRRRVQTAASFALVVLGPILVISTFLMLGPLEQGANSPSLRLILLADIVYVLVVAALVLGRVATMIGARRDQSAGSKLHMRLTGVFTAIALVPTVLVAIFAGLTINIGLEGWFSDRVRNVVGASLSAAEAYEQEHVRDLRQDTAVLAGYLNVARSARYTLSDGEIRQVLTQGQQQVQRGLREAYVIDGSGEIRARGERSYLFDFEKPSPVEMQRAADGEVVIIEDWDTNEFRALIKLTSFLDRFLYVSREVDGDILSLLDETTESILLYNQLEDERGRILFEFSLLYLGFALILILAAIWLGLWFAERLSRPIGRLAAAAEKVGEGDLRVQVREESGDDEIAILGRVFNQMTRQLKVQRDELLETNAKIETRRRLFEAVLTSITAGVIGLDAEGRVDFMNPAAIRLLNLPLDAGDHHDALAKTVPEFAGLLARLRVDERSVTQEEIKITRDRAMETLLVRLAERRSSEGELEGYVVAFDDVTQLVTAQRMAAWGDVARRIAHEIKNPLTPIQLSAERLKRKFTRKLDEEDAESLGTMTDVIVRQTNDLRRIVDEFSKFARMPEPDRRDADLTELVENAVTLQKQQLGKALHWQLPDGPTPVHVDETMIGQALTNIIKNGGEAIESLEEKGAPSGFVPEIRVTLERLGSQAEVRVSDNGIGLPEDRGRLFEPYVTTRAKGTGLGLPIVKKIIEEHGGTLELVDAPVFEGNAHHGAQAIIRLPAAVGLGQAAE